MSVAELSPACTLRLVPVERVCTRTFIPIIARHVGCKKQASHTPYTAGVTCNADQSRDHI